MATVAQSKPVSNIAVAFAAHSASNTIPIPRHVAAATATHSGPFPTPPNSLSPTLPAHNGRSDAPVVASLPSRLSPDMEIDLQDAVDHAAAQDQPASALSKEALAGLDATRQITAMMLAKFHLPGIFLGHGAMPIREVMAHLTQSVPGFSRLAPSKARRLVVAALEHRSGGGLHGEVKFEKVGWGRWTLAGQSAHANHGVPIGAHGAARNGPTPPSSLDRTGLRIPGKTAHTRDVYSGSWAAGSPDSQDEEMADGMSLDGSDASDSSSSDLDMDLDKELNDDTDEEDWSAVGPEALRHRPRPVRHHYRDYNFLSKRSGSRICSTSAQSVPGSYSRTQRPPALHAQSYSAAPRENTGTFAASTTKSSGGQAAERDAIEALIAMGSM